MKNAWMILAHNQFPMLKKLIAFLDGEDSGIFLHIDQKAAEGARYVGWFPAKQGPSGKTVEFDLIFEVE